MDKQTGSNSSSQGTSESRDIGLGCGPSPTTSAATASSSPSSSTSTSSPATVAGGGVGGGGVASTSKFTSIASQQQLQAIAPSGATISGAIVGPAPQSQHTQPPLTLNINTTTGGNFSVIVDSTNTVENLRKVIAKKLKVAKDRICLLHREKELQEGTLRDNGLMDGSKIILIPNVETGLLAQRPENTVMQALESLNDSQVNDFLSGKTPLNLSMRLGDHMMLIQLQLSTVNPVNSTGHSSSSSSRTRSSQRSSRSSLSSAAGSSSQSGHNHHSHHHHHHHHHPNSQSTSATTSVASTSVSAPRKLDIDAANGAHTSHRQRMTSVSTMPSLRLPPPTGSSIRSSDLSSFLSKRDYESLQNIVRSIAMAKPTKMPPPATTTTVGAQTEPLSATATAIASSSTTCCSKTIGCAAPSNATPSAGFHAPEEPTLLEQSPIKSLSNLVSSPIKTTAIKNIPIASNGGSSSSSSAVVATITGDSTAVATCQDAISAKLTSCLCTRLNSTSASATSGSPKSCIESTCQSRQEVVDTSITESRAAMLTSTPSKSSSSTMIATSSPSSSLLHKTANNPIGRSKHRHHHHHHHHHHHYHHHGNSSSSSGCVGGAGSSLRKMSVSPRSSSVLSTSTNDSGFVSETDASAALVASQQQTASPTTASPTSVELDDSGVTLTDTRTLAEASRNLTQTLRKLSKEVFTNKIDLSSEETPRKSSSGAVIESMKNHGKGIYSGTFSGTLNPALQDRYGRPKRDISTVIHILNDLLSATPQYSRGARISFEAPSTSSSAAATTSSGHASRSKQHPSKHHHHSYAHSLDSCVKCSKSQHQSSATGSNSSACAYGECNGHYANATSKHAKHASFACCQDLSVAASSHHHQSIDANNSNDRNTCNCRYRIHSETGEREREHMCQKCLVEMENNKTKSKLDQLRLVMQQRKQKREARKLKGAPYGARVVGATTGVTSSDVPATVTTASTGGVGSAASSTTTNPLTTQLATASSSEVSPNHIVEEVDTAA